MANIVYHKMMQAVLFRWAGSGSTSGNVYLDPGTKKKS